MRASIAMILAAAAVSQCGSGIDPGPPVDDGGLLFDRWCVVEGGNVVIPILANDPEGSLLCALNETPVPGGTIGRVVMRGNQAQYFAPDGFEGFDSFTYETNGGMATVRVVVVNDIDDCGTGGGGGNNNDAFPVILQNQTNFDLNFSVLTNNGLFFRDCTPLTSPDDEVGLVQVSGMTVEPMAPAELCVEIGNNNTETVGFQVTNGTLVDSAFRTFDPDLFSSLQVTVTFLQGNNNQPDQLVMTVQPLP